MTNTPMNTSIIGPVSRRALLGGLLGASALTVLPGCADLVTSVVDSCPTDLAESGGVTWVPDAVHPVFYGSQDLTVAANGVPRDMMVYYPSYDGSPQSARMLKLCVTRWPVVLLLHGQPPGGVPSLGYHRRWSLLPSVLARCGYVVVVPNHSALLPGSVAGSAAAVQAAMADVAWVRQNWSEANWVDKRPEMTAVAGHSFGALLAARIAAARPTEIGAFVSLSGGYLQLDDGLAALQAVTAPSLFLWAKGSGPAILFEDLDGAGKLWDKLTQPKYAGPFQGEHFDYLRAADTANEQRGACSLIGGAAADLAALFIAAHVTVGLSRTRYPIDLTVPQVQLTQQQQFYAGAHLAAQDQMSTMQGCRLDLRWNVNSATGTRRIGPPSSAVG